MCLCYLKAVLVINLYIKKEEEGGSQGTVVLHYLTIAWFFKVILALLALGTAIINKILLEH